MADGLYVGMAAAAARAEQLDAVANNLANAQAAGYKGARPAFQSFLPGRGPTDKVFAAAVATGIDLTPGPVIATENPLDVAPEGPNTFLAVRNGAGQTAYTRNGAMAVGEDRTLQIGGWAVLGADGVPITVPPDTTVSVTIDGLVVADNEEIGRLGLTELRGAVQALAPSIYAPGAGGQAVPVLEGKVRVGALEMGNVGPLESTVDMIGAQRHFESAMQAIQTYRRMDEKAIELGRVR